MTIDWAAFTPYSALLGGIFIGMAAAMLIVGIGRVAGIASSCTDLTVCLMA